MPNVLKFQLYICKLILSEIPVVEPNCFKIVVKINEVAIPLQELWKHWHVSRLSLDDDTLLFSRKVCSMMTAHAALMTGAAARIWFGGSLTILGIFWQVGYQFNLDCFAFVSYMPR